MPTKSLTLIIMGLKLHSTPWRLTVEDSENNSKRLHAFYCSIPGFKFCASDILKNHFVRTVYVMCNTPPLLN